MQPEATPTETQPSWQFEALTWFETHKHQLVYVGVAALAVWLATFTYRHVRAGKEADANAALAALNRPADKSGKPAQPAAAAPAPAPGGKTVTLPFPAKAQLVIQVNGVEQTRERIGKLLGAAAPIEAAFLNKAIDDGLQKVLTGRKTTAIPKDGRWFVVARELGALGEEETPIAVLIPVTDAKAFRESFLTAEVVQSTNIQEVRSRVLQRKQ